MIDIALACSCGHVRGEVSDVSPSSGIHVKCSCDDCQAYAHALDRADDLLDAHDGTELFQITPSQMTITRGAEHIRCLRLAEGGLLRWYTECCKTPIGNTAANSSIPFVGVPTRFMQLPDDAAEREEILGPIRGRVHEKFASVPPPEPTGFLEKVGVLGRSIKLIGWGWLRGNATPSPFFDADTGQPRVEPDVLDQTRRENAYAATDEDTANVQ